MKDVCWLLLELAGSAVVLWLFYKFEMYKSKKIIRAMVADMRAKGQAVPPWLEEGL